MNIGVKEKKLKIFLENFDKETIANIDYNNLQGIMIYLHKNGIYYLKDLLISSFDLFLLRNTTFIQQFEKLKTKLGSDYIEKLASSEGLIDIIYED